MEERAVDYLKQSISTSFIAVLHGKDVSPMPAFFRVADSSIADVSTGPCRGKPPQTKPDNQTEDRRSVLHRQRFSSVHAAVNWLKPVPALFCGGGTVGEWFLGLRQTIRILRPLVRICRIFLPPEKLFSVPDSTGETATLLIRLSRNHLLDRVKRAS